jgi:hypothetical protein
LGFCPAFSYPSAKADGNTIAYYILFISHTLTPSGVLKISIFEMIIRYGKNIYLLMLRMSVDTIPLSMTAKQLSKTDTGKIEIAD